MLALTKSIFSKCIHNKFIHLDKQFQLKKDNLDRFMSFTGQFKW